MLHEDEMPTRDTGEPGPSSARNEGKSSEVYFAEMGYRIVSKRPKRKGIEPGIYDQISTRSEEERGSGGLKGE